MEVTPYRISTITGIASLNQKIDLKIMYDNLDEYIKPVNKELKSKIKLTKKEKHELQEQEEREKENKIKEQEVDLTLKQLEEEVDKEEFEDRDYKFKPQSRSIQKNKPEKHDLIKENITGDSEIFYAEYGSTKNVLQYKGENIKKKRKKRIEQNLNIDNQNEIEYKIKRFDNQATIFINHKGNYINLKIFKMVIYK